MDETSDSTVPQGFLIDGEIERLLKEQPNRDSNNWDAERRERSGFYQIQNAHEKFDSGDTLILVDFPPSFVDCMGVSWTSKRFRVDSEKLLGTGSKVFKHLLSPKEQTRFHKRLERRGEPIPQGFVIDLTPSTEGDELAAQLIELSLPAGVREWWTTYERLGVSPYLVSGHDDHCPRHATVFNDCHRAGIDTRTWEYDSSFGLPKIDLADIEIPKARDIDDYCPIRHRANIVRLLLAIQGQDLVLNSAARVYTLTGIAKILDCTNVVRDPVLTWLMADPNSDFIDIHPEHALKIAWTLELPTVTRAAFRILVTEKVMDSFYVDNLGQGNQYTVFGRPRADLPDDIQTVIQYAALKYADRIQQRLARLTSDNICDLFELPEYRKLALVKPLVQARRGQSSSRPEPKHPWEVLRDPELLAARITDGVARYVVKIVQNSLLQPPPVIEIEYIERDRRCYVPRERWIPTSTIYDTLPDAARLLTRHFWINLNTFIGDTSNLENNIIEDVARLDRALAGLTDNANNPSPSSSSTPNPDPDLDPDPLNLSSQAHATPGLLPFFNPYDFHHELKTAILAFGGPSSNGAKLSSLEAPLNRTNHLRLDLADDEFQYLPLWADGLDDGTGGVFEEALPDADLGPAGPGPGYRTGGTVAFTEVSSIAPSAPTVSLADTGVTMTAGRSLAAVRSDTGAESARAVSAAAASVAPDDSLSLSGAGDVSDDAGEFGDDDDNDELDDEVWSVVEAP
ncbi:hypothetical protein F5B20DRAFT_561810 [Whalleya microplaca]|nr:hypothetical protein F5B20DRAFT_561810 [Whalleya microplaca]